MDVLLEDVLLGVDAEQDLEGVQRVRAQRAAVLPQHRDRRVPRHQPRQHEVDGERRPQGEGEEAEAAESVSQGSVTPEIFWTAGRRVPGGSEAAPGTWR